MIRLFGTALPLCSLPGRLQAAGSALIHALASRGRRALHGNRGTGPRGEKESLGGDIYSYYLNQLLIPNTDVCNRHKA